MISTQTPRWSAPCQDWDHPRRPGARRVRRRAEPLRQCQVSQKLRRHVAHHPGLGHQKRRSWPASSATAAWPTPSTCGPSPPSPPPRRPGLLRRPPGRRRHPPRRPHGPRATASSASSTAASNTTALYDERIAWGHRHDRALARVTAPRPVPSPNETDHQLVTSPNETTRPGLCAGPGCTNPIPPRPTGRPARFCSTACRARSHRTHPPATEPVTVEIDRGSASSRGRPPQRHWLIRLRRGDRSIIVAIGLPRTGAEHLAQQINELLNPNP